jgi:hypothetical protein
VRQSAECMRTGTGSAGRRLCRCYYPRTCSGEPVLRRAERSAIITIRTAGDPRAGTRSRRREPVCPRCKCRSAPRWLRTVARCTIVTTEPAAGVRRRSRSQISAGDESVRISRAAETCRCASGRARAARGRHRSPNARPASRPTPASEAQTPARLMSCGIRDAATRLAELMRTTTAASASLRQSRAALPFLGPESCGQQARGRGGTRQRGGFVAFQTGSGRASVRVPSVI